MNAPTVKRLRSRTGIAGQFQITATVAYPDEPDSTVVFVGSVYGSPGPVVMITELVPLGTFVRDPGRFGQIFGQEWVSTFLTEQSPR